MRGRGCLRGFWEFADSWLLQRMNRELLGLPEGDFEPCLSLVIKEQKGLLFLGRRPSASSLSAAQLEQRRCPRSLLAPLPAGQPWPGGFGTHGSLLLQLLCALSCIAGSRMGMGASGVRPTPSQQPV